MSPVPVPGVQVPGSPRPPSAAAPGSLASLRSAPPAAADQSPGRVLPSCPDQDRIGPDARMPTSSLSIWSYREGELSRQTGVSCRSSREGYQTH